MCGIVGAVAQRDIAELLLEGLKRLEYRGYDSAGLAIIDHQGSMNRLCRVGKVNDLSNALNDFPIAGATGIAHTRWATHGRPSEQNAHPHLSDNIAVVHNGIIENYQFLRSMLTEHGYRFASATDSEVIAHLTHWEQQKGGTLLEVVRRVMPQLKGAYGALIMDSQDPSRLIAARSGSPLVIGLGDGENFIASDPLALLLATRRFIYLDEGDIAEVSQDNITIINKLGITVDRKEVETFIQYDVGNKGMYRHYMQKEIYDQPIAIKNTLEGCIEENRVNLTELIGKRDLLEQVEHIQIVACGTSYHAGMVARNWFEALADIPCDVEIASEFRYRKSARRPASLFITLSQSGETADTLAALRLSKEQGFLGSLAICNVASSSLVRESDVALMTQAGIEIGVASTKAFTTQLTLLLLLVTYFARLRGTITEQKEQQIVQALQELPSRIEQILYFEQLIEPIAQDFRNKNHALFLGRGEHYPIAMEGALKLKEISYIHAEAYAAGELKHGPLALIDADMPVIIIAPSNELLAKLKANIEEVQARGGQLYVFADEQAGFYSGDNMTVILLPHTDEIITPIIYTILLQLLAYHTALVKGTDVDQPRNLAKSVTVE